MDEATSPKTPREGYAAQSRRPLAALAFVLPLVLLYEAGTWLFHVDDAARTETRIVAFTWVSTAFERLGATGPLLPPLAVVAALLGWHVFARHPWRLRPGVMVGMLFESVLLSLPLLALVGVMTGRSPLPLFAGEVRETVALAVLGVGAGVYEELLFRLIAFAVLLTLLHDVMGLRPAVAATITVVVTSLAFSAYHYLGPEPFEPVSFAFRAMAGSYLGVVFLLRGFGIAAGAHAAYDVLLVVLIENA